jgi:hypothetical protein
MQSGADHLVSVKKDGKSIAFIPDGANLVKGIVKGNEITYPGIFTDADVRYQMQGGGVKEDIILQRFNGNNTFAYEMKLNGLNPVVEEDGTISFIDRQGNKTWYFEKPYMTDASENIRIRFH